MLQLSGSDTSFLTMETSTQFGHVGGLSIWEPGADLEATRRQLEERMDLLPYYRRRLVEVPFGLDNPYWINDPEFDIDFHLRHIAVPPPGTDAQLADLVARLASRPMDRSRPLWELYVIEGLESGDIAQYAKTHHAAIDGSSATEAATVLMDAEPDAPPPALPEQPWAPDRVPSDMALLGHTALSFARRPARLARAQLRMTREVAALTRNGALRVIADQALSGLGRLGRVGRERDRPALPSGTAPPTPFNGSITAHRRWAFTTLSLSRAKDVKNAYGVTLNDVVLAICAGALRTYLQDVGALPDEQLIANCPVSIRTGNEAEMFSNRVSFMLAPLATDIADPGDRLRRINEGTEAAKQQFNAVPADALQDFSQFAPPAVAAQASRLMASLRIGDRMSMPYNLVISNVPGPRHPLYLGGAMMKHSYPVSGVMEGMGLNITVASYMDSLDFGLISCRELVPEVWDLAGHLGDALDELYDTI